MRSRAREVALQLLYQRDLNPRVPRPVVERFAADRLRDPPLAPFCLGLYDGVVGHACASAGVAKLTVRMSTRTGRGAVASEQPARAAAASSEAR